MTALALLLREDDWIGYLWFVVFVLLPLVARGLRALLKRLGVPLDEAEASGRPSPREARAEQRRAEAEGEDLWRRLARGELPASPEPARPAAPVPAPAPREIRSLEGATLEQSSLEREMREEGEPAPLAVLGEVVEPGAVPAASLETEAEPAPLAALSSPLPEAAARVRRKERRWILARGDLRRSIVLAEILGPPVSERRDAG